MQSLSSGVISQLLQGLLPPPGPYYFQVLSGCSMGRSMRQLLVRPLAHRPAAC
jgi:hypothetical protein